MNLLNNKIDHLNIYLASKSPRRLELLKNIIPKFEILTKEIEEIYPKNLPSNEIAQFLAVLKAESFLKDSNKNNLFITADTIVVLEDKVLGKPKDFKDAFSMLKELSSKTHTVYTGVAFLHNQKFILFKIALKLHFMS